MWARHFCKIWGWGDPAVGTSGSGPYKPHDHVDLVTFRRNKQQEREKHHIRIGLTLNYDQMFKETFQHKTAQLHKSGSNKVTSDPTSKLPAKRRQALARFKRKASVNADASPTHAATTRGRTRRTTMQMTDPEANYDEREMGPRVDPTDNEREGFTILTSTWDDGTRGPLAFCFRDGWMPSKVIKEINAENVGEVYCMHSQTDSHFMTAQTTLEVFHQLYTPPYGRSDDGLEWAPMRRQASLAMRSRGILRGRRGRASSGSIGWRASMLSAFSQYHPKGSAKAQPCDAYHQHYRRLCNIEDNNEVGFQTSLFKRPKMSSLEFRAWGVKRKISKKAQALGRLKAWRGMPQRVSRHAWVSRGLTSVNDVAAIAELDPEVVGAEVDALENDNAYADHRAIYDGVAWGDDAPEAGRAGGDAARFSVCPAMLPCLSP